MTTVPDSMDRRDGCGATPAVIRHWTLSVNIVSKRSLEWWKDIFWMHEILKYLLPFNFQNQKLAAVQNSHQTRRWSLPKDSKLVQQLSTVAMMDTFLWVHQNDCVKTLDFIMSSHPFANVRFTSFFFYFRPNFQKYSHFNWYRHRVWIASLHCAWIVWPSEWLSGIFEHGNL